MPAVNFEVQWPDGDVKTYYSPSTVIRQYLKDDHYSLDEFAERISLAMNMASERVREKFGYYCSSASDELLQINAKIHRLRDLQFSGNVRITHIN